MRNSALCTIAATAFTTWVGGCTTLPASTELPVSADLQEIYHDSTISLRQRPGFNSASFDAARIDSVDVTTPANANNDDRAAYAALQMAFSEAASKTKPASARSTTAPVRIEVVVRDVRLVDPALNVVSAIALLVPLDTGAMTLEATFLDAQGIVVAQRIERIGGSPLDIANALSRSGRLERAARDWVAACSLWPACAVPPEGLH